MYKIAVLGDQDSIFGYSALGLDIFPINEAKEAEITFKKLTQMDYGIIYVTESTYEYIRHLAEEIRSNPLPAVIPIPGVVGNTGAGMKAVRLSVEQAVGSDIIFGGED